VPGSHGRLGAVPAAVPAPPRSCVAAGAVPVVAVIAATAHATASTVLAARTHDSIPLMTPGQRERLDEAGVNYFASPM
jgi:hypothetical protein